MKTHTSSMMCKLDRWFKGRSSLSFLP